MELTTGKIKQKEIQNLEDEFDRKIGDKESQFLERER